MAVQHFDFAQFKLPVHTVAVCDPEFHFLCRLAVAAAGPDAIEPLILLLTGDIDNDTMWYVSNALAKTGEPCVDSLIEVLKNFPDDNVKRYAAAALAGIGAPAVHELIAIFEDDDSVTRGLASKALIRIGRPAVGPLSSFIRESDAEEISHRCAVITLEKLGSSEPESVEKVL